MRRTLATCVVVAVALLVWPGGAQAQHKTLETEDLRLLYIDPIQTFMVPYTARCFENSMEFQRALWDYTPSEPVSVLLMDMSDMGNAAAGYVPRNSLLVESSPLSYTYETVLGNEHMNWIMNHELVHIATADRAAGSDVTFRKIFQGKVAAVNENPESIAYFYLTTPRHAAPRWFREGSAVFVETWMAGGMGRAIGAWDEMVFRTMVRDEARFYDPLGLVSEGEKTDFQAGANAYLYGTRFISYLAHEYGPETFVAWNSRTPGTRKYYASQFKQVYGKSIKEAWKEWIEFEHRFQQVNLERVREFPLTPYEDLSPRAWGSVSPAYYDEQEQRIYAAFNYPGTVSHLGAISVEDGSVEKLIEIKGPVIYDVTSLTFDPDSRTLFYTTDNHEHRNLEAYDLETGKNRRLLKKARIGDLAFNRADRSIWGVRHFNGYATLARVPHPYDEWNRVHTWPFGEVIYNVNVSPDGKLLAASIGEISGRHTLRVYETEKLLAGEVSAILEFDFGKAIPSNFSFGPESRFLYGSSYYTGVSNIFRFEIGRDGFEAMTNTDGGFFRPIPLGNDELIVFRFTGQGFVPAKIKTQPLEDINAITFLGNEVIEKYPELEDWNVGSPAEVDLDSLVTERGEEYKPFKSIGFESWYPVVEGYKDFGAVGARVNLSDPISMNKFNFTTSYTPDSDLPSEERLHFTARYERYDWKASLRYNGADFYDLFGPTKLSRKGWALTGEHTKTLIYDSPRTLELAVFAGAYYDIDQLPRYQNVDVLVDELYELGAELTYENKRASIGAVDHEKGIGMSLYGGAQLVEGDVIPAMLGTLDFGFELPLKNSSIWLRNSAGFAVGDLDDPFANFFFGAFGNNYVDHRTVKRYRQYYAFPGLDLQEIGGRNFAKSLLEWNLPPLRFRRVGTPAFYLTYARASLFVAGIGTNLGEDSDVRTQVGDVGVQVDFRMTLLSRLKLTLSLGYAQAFENAGDSSDEFMFSLKIL